jgi:acyl transferase domain-containing protein
MSQQHDLPATAIAIVGMACRFPGARNTREYWANLRDGRESRTELGPDELRAAGVPKSLLEDPHYVPSGMFLEDMEMFDGDFFGFSAGESAILDPQHRHFLECAWEALEDAGCDPARFPGAIGVFAGSGHNAYMPYNLLTNPGLMHRSGLFLVRHTGNDKDFLTTRASYVFNLRGPSVNVATACSTSLVATHLACQSLLSGECDAALAGGVTIVLPHRQGYLYKDGEILSPDGHCRPFEAHASGTLFGSGVGVVVLKRLDDALAAGDRVHAVIRGSAINNDGSGKVSYLAPSVDGQAACIAEALSIAGVDAGSIGFVEAHGTGTFLGDPIEVAALTQAFRGHTDRTGYCALGSVKSNIGHTDTAAGVASLIKAVLAMQHRQIPATLHFEQPNPSIDFAESPFYVNAQCVDWTAQDTPRRAGVSSLGVGGTNAHVVIEEAPPAPAAPAARREQLLVLSARSDTALGDMAENLAAYLEASPDARLADVAYTLQAGRQEMPRRRFVVADSVAAAVAALRADDARSPVVEAPSARRQVTFMFAGGGAQYPNMGRALYEREPVYRAAVDDCLRVLARQVDFDLRALLFPEPGNEAAAARELQRPSRTIPALFITQYAQAQQWLAWGVEPAAMIGHSMGENTAACVAGVLKLEDAIGLVRLRGELFEQTRAGGMLSIPVEADKLAPYLGSELSIACVNAPGYCVASGPVAAIEQMQAALGRDGIEFSRIRIDVAAHSALLEPILGRFGAYLRTLELAPPRIPFASNVTGTWITDAEATNPGYWVRHLRQTVRFSDGMGEVLRKGSPLLLEVGPGRTLASLAQMHPERRDAPIVTSLPHPDEDVDAQRFMLTALGRLWQGGAGIDWQRLHGDASPRRVSLPTYPFEHRRHWVEPGRSLYSEGIEDTGLEPRERLEDWFYQPVWTRTPRADVVQPGARVLLLTGGDAVGHALAAAFAARAVACVTAQPGDAFAGDAEGMRFRIAEAADYGRLLAEFRRLHGNPTHIVHALACGPSAPAADALSGQVERAFHSFVALAQTVGNEHFEAAPALVALTTGACQVAGEPLEPLRALLQGPCLVVPQELDGTLCRMLDFAPDGDLATTARRVAADVLSAATDGIVAHRGQARFTRSHAPAPMPQPAQPFAPRSGGVYLVSGGLGGLGLEAAGLLARPGVTLVLVNRSPFLPRERWQAWRDSHPASDPVSRRIDRLQALDAAGAQVHVVAADVADGEAMRALVADVRARHGGLHGVLHTAGVIDDGLLLLKSRESMDAVLRPKVQGTLALDAAIGDAPLDFFVLYSSVSAFSGMAGQADYAAANAFLDAFAAHRNARDGSRTCAINWTAWRELGMAADKAGGRSYVAPPVGNPVAHPMLDVRLVDRPGDDGAAYSSDFSSERHWVIGEHALRGVGHLMPGSGYLELVRAAFCDWRGESPVEIEDVTFVIPFTVPDGTSRGLRTRLTAADGAWHGFEIESRGDDGAWQTHVSGRIRASTFSAPPAEAAAALRARCTRRSQAFDDPGHHPQLELGSRWRVLQRVGIGDGEAVIDLDMAAHADELAVYRLHPALIDMATAGAQAAIDGYDPHAEFFVPMGYGRLRFGGSLPARGFSHVRLRPRGTGSHADAIVAFDVVIADDTGKVHAVVDEFMMQRVPVSRIATPPAAASRLADEMLARVLALGIDPADGTAALARILALPVQPQLAVSPRPLDRLLVELRGLGGRAGARRAAPAPAEAEDDPALAPVEALLATHSAVAAAVVRRYGRGDDRHIVAHVEFRPDGRATPSELRRFLRKDLRSDLVPQHFDELDALPRLADGGVDRRALADPFGTADFVEPRNDVERALARIWCEVLGIDRVGVHDNFFDVGGHSILSIRVIAAVDRKLGVRLNQKTMVMQTLEQIAAEISGRRPAEDAAPTPTTPAAAAVAPSPAPKGFLKRVFGR